MRPILTSLILLAALWALAQGLEGFGLVAFVALILATAVPITLQGGWAAALDRGHLLDRFAPDGRLRALLSGWMLRLSGRFVVAVAVVASAMLYRLHSGGPELLCLAAAPFVLAALLHRITPLMSAEMRPQFALAQSLKWAKWGTVAVLLVLWLGLGAATSAPTAPLQIDAVAGAKSAVVGEYLALGHLWRGLEGFVFGQVATLGSWGRAGAALLAVAGTVGLFWAAVSAIAVFWIPRAELARAVRPAGVAGAPGAGAWTRAGGALVVASALALAGAGWLEARLSQRPPEARPVTGLMQPAERIGDAWYKGGTLAALEELDSLRRAAFAQAAEPLAAAVNAGFDRMEANLDGFLDWYYSLPAEYARLGQLVAGDFEDYLSDQLTERLAEGDPFGGLEAALDLAETTEIATLDEWRGAREALLAQNALDARGAPMLDTGAGVVPPLPVRDAGGNIAATRDWMRGRAAVTGAAGVSGAVAGAMAGRLAAKGTVRLAAGALRKVAGARIAGGGAGAVVGGWVGGVAGSIVPGPGTALGATVGAAIGGIAAGVGTDQLLLMLDEEMNREALRAELLSEIEAARTEALDALSD
ncbi:hypothetical protein ACW9UR_20285 [Halovulum sp. GXIMD14794]